MRVFLLNMLQKRNSSKAVFGPFEGFKVAQVDAFREFEDKKFNDAMQRFMQIFKRWQIFFTRRLTS